ncbi:NACHT domain-containing protein [Kitasatospora sp. NPDC059577]|uniref:NACHT domain-containing protein n=1 Tax=Kitasatospora sp. NPDC059577 TaxID=3346873 RepID=UPI00367B550F
MPNGRPRKTDQQPLPELSDLAEWFHAKLQAAGHVSVNAFRIAPRPPGAPALPPKDSVYDILNARRLCSLPTTRQLATALGQPPEAVTAVWKRARRQLERRELALRDRTRAAGVPDVDWTDVPLPDPWLDGLLRSQAAAAEQFPYDVLGVVKPPLSDIYVEQDVQPLAQNGDREEPHGPYRDETPRPYRAGPQRPSRPASTLAEALSAHGHLFITGGPGTGKTTLGQHLVRQVARYWLREDDTVPWYPSAVVAVRITSAGLHLPQAWYRQLSEAVNRSGTHADPVHHDRFADRAHGVRWLVVVDGLDEVSSPIVRHNVLRTLAEQMTPGGHFRFVITSRPLPQGELEPFGELPGVGFYTLKGFDADQQLAFAERWFRAQGMDDAVTHARRFLDEVDQAGLHEVLRVPLLATIAAAYRSRNPHAPLPRGRIALYEAFLEQLRTAREGNTEVRKRFVRRWEQRDRGHMASWLLDNRDLLVTHLAWARLDGSPSTSLLRSARQWLASHLPAGTHWPEESDGELGQFLAQSGVLSFDGTELSFLHQSFAEFLAARDEAAAIPSDFPELGSWSAAATSAGARNRMLFTAALWARRPGNDVAVIVRHLLAGELPHRILALRLVTAGVPLGEALERSVIDRLLDFADDGNPRFSAPDSEVLAELSQLRGNRRLAARLRAIAGQAGVPAALRTGAAAALANVASLREGVVVLEGMASTEEPGTVVLCCRHLAALDPSGTPFRAEVLRRLLTDPRASTWDRLTAGELLVEEGVTEGVAELARSVLAGPEHNDQRLERAGELWFAVEGLRAAEEVARVIGTRKDPLIWTTRGLILTLLRFGRTAEAAPLTQRLLNESISSDDIGDVVTAWVDAESTAGADLIVRSMRGHSPWNADERPSIAHTLLLEGFTDQALELVRMSLDASPRSRYSLQLEFMVLARALGPDSADEMLQWLEKLDATPEDHASALRLLIDAGAAPTATMPFAHRLIHQPGSSNPAFVTAAHILLQRGGASACEEILDALDHRPYGGTALCAGLLPVLVEHGQDAAVMDLGRRLLDDPGLTRPELRAVVRSWVAVAGSGAVRTILDRASAALATIDQVAELASLLAAEGLREEAVPLWCRICGTAGAAVSTRWQALQSLIASEAHGEADRTLREALAARPDPAEAAVLRQLQAWLAASA